MKVGILTFHRTTNYGAVLQAYALQKTISSLGYDVEIIDYNNIDIYSYSDYRIFYGKLPFKTRIGKVIRYPQNKRIAKKFELFRNKWMNLSDECNSHEQLQTIEDKYDMVVCGSDQVWNPFAIHSDFNAFLLSNVKGKRISYAASAGNVSLWTKFLKVYWTYLHQFDSISVRESEMLQPTENLSQKKVTLVLDPTLLLNEKIWENLEEPLENNIQEKKYILVYYLGKNKAMTCAIKTLQKQTGLPVVLLGRKIEGVQSICIPAGPGQFLTLFHNAKYVLTSSFHGTVFSILYRKPFLVFGNGSYNSRMDTLLSALKLENRMIINENINLAKIDETIDWEQVDVLHKHWKEKSISFLMDALK